MSIAQNWRIKRQRYSLVGEICPQCGNKLFPPRDVCPHCTQPAYEPYQFSGRGEIYSFTTMNDAPVGFEKYTPYTVALVKLEEGALVTGQITDAEPEEIHIGLAVEMVTRKLSEEGEEGQIRYSYKFRPRLEAPVF